MKRFEPSNYQKSKRYKLNGKIYKITYSKVSAGYKYPHCVSKGNQFWYSKTYELKTDDGWKYLHGAGVKQ